MVAGDADVCINPPGAFHGFYMRKGGEPYPRAKIRN